MEVETKQFIGDVSNEELNDRVCKMRNEPLLDYCGNIQWAIDLLKFVPEAVIMPVFEDKVYPSKLWEIRIEGVYRSSNLARLCVIAYIVRNTL